MEVRVGGEVGGNGWGTGFGNYLAHEDGTHAKIPSSGLNAPFFSIDWYPSEYLCACVSMWSWGAFLELECAKLNHHPSAESHQTPNKGEDIESMVF